MSVSIQSAPGAAQIGTSFSQGIRVQVLDGATPVSGAYVSFIEPSSASTPGCTWDGYNSVQAQTDSGGYAECGAPQANQYAGSYDVDCICNPYGSTSVQLTNQEAEVPSSYWHLQLISGGPSQQTAPNTQFPQKVRVRFFNNLGNPVSVQPVNFSIPSGSVPGGTFVPSGLTYISVNTDANGYADSPFVLANNRVGAFYMSCNAAQITRPEDQVNILMEILDGAQPLLFCEA